MKRLAKQLLHNSRIKPGRYRITLFTASFVSILLSPMVSFALSSGETSSGETSSGETSSGETSSGETSSGESSSGELSSGELSLGKPSPSHPESEIFTASNVSSLALQDRADIQVNLQLSAENPRFLPSSFDRIALQNPVTPLTQPNLSLQTLVQQGKQLYQLGQFVEAAETWEQAVLTSEMADNTARNMAETAVEQRLLQALILNYLSLAYQELNQWQLAWQKISQSLDLLQQSQQQTSSIVLAQALGTQAKLFLQVGQTEDALSNWQRAQALYEGVNDTEGALGSQINQARALQSLGFYRRAQHQLQIINNQLTALTDSNLKVNGLRSLGLAYQVTGNLQQSYQALQESLAIAQRLGSTQELGATLLILGRTALDLGNPKSALNYFQQADQATQNPREQMQAQLGQLYLYLEAQNEIAPAENLTAKPSSEPNLETIQTLIQNVYQNLHEQLTSALPNRFAIYGTVNLSARLLQFSQTSPLAPIQMGELLATAIHSARQLQDAQAEAYALQQLAQLYMQNQQLAEAKALMQQALSIAHQIRANDITSQSAWKLGRLIKQQWETEGKTSEGLYDQAVLAYDQAITALKALRGDLVAINPEVQFSFQSSIEPIYREAISLQLEGEPTQQELERVLELAEALQLAELDNFFRQACLDVQPQQIDEIDRNATVIYPILLPDRLAVIVSSGNQELHYHTIPIVQAEAKAELDALLGSFHPAFNYAEQVRLSKRIYDWLIRPAEQAQILQGAHTLVFVLDGPLRNLPIAALYDGEQYLIEKYAIALSPGLQLLVGEPLDVLDTRAILAGISKSHDGFNALPAVETEIQAISQLVSASTLLNHEFTQAALAQSLQNSPASIIHLATHGQFSSRQEETFLLTWDGRLNINDLGNLLQSQEDSVAQPVELLVLSACDTAVGDDRAVLGLAGVAVRSGARSTIATLWTLKDEVAALLLTALYRELQKPGITKAEALRQAQLEVLRETDFRHPFFWSGFVLVGNWL